MSPSTRASSSKKASKPESSYENLEEDQVDFSGSDNDGGNSPTAAKTPTTPKSPAPKSPAAKKKKSQQEPAIPAKSPAAKKKKSQSEQPAPASPVTSEPKADETAATEEPDFLEEIPEEEEEEPEQESEAAKEEDTPAEQEHKDKTPEAEQAVSPPGSPDSLFDGPSDDEDAGAGAGAAGPANEDSGYKSAEDSSEPASSDIESGDPNDPTQSEAENEDLAERRKKAIQARRQQTDKKPRWPRDAANLVDRVLQPDMVAPTRPADLEKPLSLPTYEDLTNPLTEKQVIRVFWNSEKEGNEDFRFPKNYVVPKTKWSDDAGFLQRYYDKVRHPELDRADLPMQVLDSGEPKTRNGKPGVVQVKPRRAFVELQSCHNGLVRPRYNDRDRKRLKVDEVHHLALRLATHLMDKEPDAGFGPLHGGRWWIAPDCYELLVDHMIGPQFVPNEKKIWGLGGKPEDAVEDDEDVELGKKPPKEPAVKRAEHVARYGDRRWDKSRFRDALVSLHWVRFAVPVVKKKKKEDGAVSDDEKEEPIKEWEPDHTALLILHKATGKTWYLDCEDYRKSERAEAALAALYVWLDKSKGVGAKRIPRGDNALHEIPVVPLKDPGLHGFSDGYHNILNAVVFIRFGILGWHLLTEYKEGGPHKAFNAMVESLHFLMGLEFKSTISFQKTLDIEGTWEKEQQAKAERDRLLDERIGIKRPKFDHLTQKGGHAKEEKQEDGVPMGKVYKQVMAEDKVKFIPENTSIEPQRIPAPKQAKDVRRKQSTTPEPRSPPAVKRKRVVEVNDDDATTDQPKSPKRQRAEPKPAPKKQPAKEDKTTTTTQPKSPASKRKRASDDHDDEPESPPKTKRKSPVEPAKPKAPAKATAKPKAAPAKATAKPKAAPAKAPAKPKAPAKAPAKPRAKPAAKPKAKTSPAKTTYKSSERVTESDLENDEPSEEEKGPAQKPKRAAASKKKQNDDAGEDDDDAAPPPPKRGAAATKSSAAKSTKAAGKSAEPAPRDSTTTRTGSRATAGRTAAAPAAATPRADRRPPPTVTRRRSPRKVSSDAFSRRGRD